MLQFKSIFFLGALLSMCAITNAANDISTIRDRYVKSVLPQRPQDIQRVRDAAAPVITSLQADGSWPDVKYDDQTRTNWPTAQHLYRIVLMAKVARMDRDAGHPDLAIDAKILSAIKYWTDRDLHNPNWWWNEIGAPEQIGEIGCLQWPNIPQAQVDAMIKILKRSVWTKWTGANLTWGVTIQIARGCMEQSTQTIADAYARLYQEIVVEPQNKEGIQADWSFHQHGQQLYNGGYGLAFANDVGRFIGFAWGTSFQVPPDKMQIYTSYLLDGERWMIYGDIFDYSAVGREVTRANKVVAPKDWARGVISPSGPGYSLPNVCEMLATLDVPRRDEFAAFEAQFAGDKSALAMSGNRHFWCSDYMMHRRDGFMTSVKMFSTRMQNSENVNAEGRKSHHLADGANLIYVDGNEYRDIFPVWDWNKIPGTTAEQMDDLIKDDPKGVGIHGKSDFVGGASDGMNGLSAMELIRGELSAKKSWMFFERAYVCLGAGITSSGDRQIITSVNQARLNGDVLTDASPTLLPIGQHDLTGVHWVYHNHIGYVFPSSQKVNLGNADQSGRWSDFGSGSDALATLPVFNLSIDHGKACHDATYQYIVLPNTTQAETATWSKSPAIKILSNTPALQAAFDEKVKLLQVAFWSAGKLASPIGEIQVDQPCLLMLQKNEGLKITAANPRNQGMTLNVQIDGKPVTLALPDGLRAGASVTTTLSPSL